MLALFAVAGLLCLWSSSVPGARAKGPVEFKLCGELGCIESNSMRFTAAVLYGGRLHDGPGCATKVHTLIADFPGYGRERRYLLVATRGLIGEQGKGGYVWWREVGGWKKTVLTEAISGTGMGFTAEPEVVSSILEVRGRPEVKPWQLRGDRLSCAPNGLAGQVRNLGAFPTFDAL